MSSYVVERPLGAFHLSRNAIRYVVQVSNPNRSDNIVDVRVRTHAVGANSSGEVNASMELSPDENGKVYAYVQDFLHEILEPVVPNADSTAIQPAASHAAEFYIEQRNINQYAIDNYSAIPFQTQEKTSKKIVVLGGIAPEKLESNNFVNGFLEASGGRFLTWADRNGRKIPFDQTAWITYLHTSTLPENFKVVVTVTKVDETTETFDLDLPVDADLDTTKVWHIPCSPQLLSLANDGTIWYYDLQVVSLNAGADVLVDVYRFYPDYRASYDYTDLLFLNSLGGWESVRIKADATRGYEREVLEYQRTIFDKAWNTTVRRGDLGHASLFRRDVYKGDVGYTDTPGEQELLLDLMHSQHIYTLVDGRWVQVLITNRSAEMRSTGDGAWSFPLEWKMSHQQHALMPDAAVLGTGEDPDVPLVAPIDEPTELIWTDMGPGVGATTTIKFEWNANGEPKTRVRYRTTDGNVWTYSAWVTNSGGEELSIDLPNDYVYQAEIASQVNDDNESRYVSVTPEIDLT